MKIMKYSKNVEALFKRAERELNEKSEGKRGVNFKAIRDKVIQKWSPIIVQQMYSEI